MMPVTLVESYNPDWLHCFFSRQQMRAAAHFSGLRVLSVGLPPPPEATAGQVSPTCPLS